MFVVVIAIDIGCPVILSWEYIYFFPPLSLTLWSFLPFVLFSLLSSSSCFVSCWFVLYSFLVWFQRQPFVFPSSATVFQSQRGISNISARQIKKNDHKFKVTCSILVFNHPLDWCKMCSVRTGKAAITEEKRQKTF